MHGPQFLLQEAAANPQDAYWQQAALLVQQWHGLVDGYNAAVPMSMVFKPVEVIAVRLFVFLQAFQFICECSLTNCMSVAIGQRRHASNERFR